MKQSINFYDFERAFHDYDRFDNFGYDGLKVIFECLESYEEDNGEEIELDVIAICCDYNMLTFEEVVSEYGLEIDTCLFCGEGMWSEDHSFVCEDCEQDNLKDFVMDYLNENTFVCGTTDDSVIFQVF